MKDKIKEVLKKSFKSVYCDTCEGNEIEDYGSCDFCHRKSMNWSISDDYAELLTDKILKQINK